MNTKPFDFIITTVPFNEQYLIVNILKELGINCSIQKSIDHWWFNGSLFGRKEIQGDASWMAAPYLDILQPPTIILHQTVSPSIAIPFLENSRFFKDWETNYLDSYTKNYCINKYVKYHGRNWNWPESTKDKIELFYVKWNELIEEKSKNRKYMRFKAESVNEDIIEKICWFIGIKIKEDDIKNVIYSSKEIKPKNIDMQFSTKVMEIAKRYDYL